MTPQQPNETKARRIRAWSTSATSAEQRLRISGGEHDGQVALGSAVLRHGDGREHVEHPVLLEALVGGPAHRVVQAGRELEGQ